MFSAVVLLTCPGKRQQACAIMTDLHPLGTSEGSHNCPLKLARSGALTTSPPSRACLLGQLPCRRQHNDPWGTPMLTVGVLPQALHNWQHKGQGLATPCSRAPDEVETVKQEIECLGLQPQQSKCRQW